MSQLRTIVKIICEVQKSVKMEKDETGRVFKRISCEELEKIAHTCRYSPYPSDFDRIFPIDKNFSTKIWKLWLD